MELPQKQRSATRPLSLVLLTFVLVLISTTLATATMKGSNGVEATESYTYSSEIIEDNSGITTLNLSQDFTKSFVHLSNMNYIVSADDQMKNEWLITQAPTPETTPEISQEDRTKPIYEVYKNGYYIEVPAETQWIIRDFATEYGFDEKIVFGLALAESTFNPNCKGDSERSLGLYQIQKYWIRGADITHFTDDYKSRNLFDPYDATLTLMEIWHYAIDSYGIDISTDQGMKDLLYWHNSGKYVQNVNWAYSNKIFGYAEELIALQN